MPRKWKKIQSKVVYKTPWFKIFEDSVLTPDGKQGTYSFLEKPAGNFIIALDKDNFVYLVKEHRYPVDKSFLQLPGGVVDSSDILEQAKKELHEETGIVAEQWQRIGGFYVAPGHETTYVNIFLATELNLTNIKTGNQENNEAIQEIVKVSLLELRQMILEEKIVCAITLAALNLFFLKY